MSTAEFALREQLHHLYNDHHGWLVAWLRRKLGCPHHAADVAQNTFMRVLLARDALCGIEQPRAWLTTTATRLLIDEARRRRIEVLYLAELSALANESIGSASPEETLVAVQALTQLSLVLDRVAPKARTAFLRHYLDGEPHATVADALGVSTRMVQKYLAQVLLQAHRLAVLP